MDFPDSFDDLFPKGALKDVIFREMETEEGVAPLKERRVWSVSELLFHINSLLDLEYGSIWVEGEVGGVSLPPSGHCFFTLKDEKGCLKSVCFKGSHAGSAGHIREGTRILCHARVNVYQARGDLQIIVDHVEPWGEGRLKIEFERLRERLNSAGLFDREKKKDLPAWPGTIFVITSPSGAAFRDFVKTARSKFPPARIVLVPSSVQGSDAPRAILQAIDMAEEAAGDSDVIVLTRGGGSMEDLWAFNDEVIAMRIHECRVPVVSGVGHEVDFTICDFVADRRAATPTAAAELVCPSSSMMAERVTAAVSRLKNSIMRLLAENRHRLSVAASRLKHPAGILIDQKLQLDDTQRKMAAAMNMSLSRKEQHMSVLRSMIAANSPTMKIDASRSVLEHVTCRMKDLSRSRLLFHKGRFLEVDSRLIAADPGHCIKKGFALVFEVSTGKVVTDAATVTEGEEVEVRLKKGSVLCRVAQVRMGGG